MGWLIGGIVLGILVILIGVILIRAVLFKPEMLEPVAAEPIELDEDKIVKDMVDMIRCKTVSNRDEALVARAEFARFEDLLKERFPVIHEKCQFEKVGKTGLVYYLPGKSSEKPSVCMAHYDVVPVEEEGWNKPAFEGLIEDDCIWGSGTLDTKGTLCGVMEALEQMLADGYVPANDLYLSFSGEEEIDGETCADIVSYLEKKKITPAIVVDEGGAVVDHVFPGVDGQCALVGISEKGRRFFEDIRIACSGYKV